MGTKSRVRFKGSCLKQDKITYDHGKIVNNYIVYVIDKNDNTSSNPTLENCLFGAVSLTENVDRYKYSGCGIWFDRHGSYSHASGKAGQNVIIFVVDMSLFEKIDNRKKEVLILGKGPTQGLIHTIGAEKMYSINFNVTKKMEQMLFAC